MTLHDLQAARNERRRELRQQLTARRGLVEMLTQPHPSLRRSRETTSNPSAAAGSASKAGTRLKLYRDDRPRTTGRSAELAEIIELDSR